MSHKLLRPVKANSAKVGRLSSQYPLFVQRQQHQRRFDFEIVAWEVTLGACCIPSKGEHGAWNQSTVASVGRDIEPFLPGWLF
jgi:hypothetical protein